MNERIEKLIVKTFFDASVDIPSDKIYTLNDHMLEKFAELIVRECMTIAQEYDGCKLSGAGTVIANRIDAHFEVNDD